MQRSAAVSRKNKSSAFLRDLASFRIILDSDQDPELWGRVRGLAEQHGLTAYDAAYLELAKRSGLPLATLDKDLQRATRSASVSLMNAFTIES